ncbi:universal stress protein [Mucilaginibacter aquariorum]|uniref:Universal stress protein n=1 Tax=Mucilaginibacter aquariorum TaxID=2967225 RepID=A0ABT1T267_9SPHI|nr:universal stress protein [Mucilaginibacter aquariorum]MCQ6958705.1 universal stress protein [Mucilaginibacter aquariorum]
MKKILVLTDFSENSVHAAAFAQVLAKQLHTGLLLYHVVQSIPFVPNYAGGGFVTETENLFAEDSRTQLVELRDKLLAGREDAASMDILTAEGDLGSNVKQLLQDSPIELIVMGAPESSVADHLLTGSETRTVIRSSERPVLVIPMCMPVKAISNFVLATDYRSEDLSVLRYLSKWAMKVDGRLDVVHVQTNGEVAALNGQQRQIFEFFLNNLEFDNYQCHDLHGKNIQERLHRFCADKKADVLAMINYHHDFFSRLLGSSHTFKALHHLQLPILVFPANFTDVAAPSEQPR